MNGGRGPFLASPCLGHGSCAVPGSGRTQEEFRFRAQGPGSGGEDAGAGPERLLVGEASVKRSSRGNCGGPDRLRFTIRRPGCPVRPERLWVVRPPRGVTRRTGWRAVRTGAPGRKNTPLAGPVRRFRRALHSGFVPTDTVSGVAGPGEGATIDQVFFAECDNIKATSSGFDGAVTVVRQGLHCFRHIHGLGQTSRSDPSLRQGLAHRRAICRRFRETIGGKRINL